MLEGRNWRREHAWELKVANEGEDLRRRKRDDRMIDGTVGGKIFMRR